MLWCSIEHKSVTPASHVGTSYGPGCSTFDSASCTCLGKQHKIAQVLGTLPSTWETQTKFPALGQYNSGHFNHLGSKSVCGIPLSFSLRIPFKLINEPLKSKQMKLRVIIFRDFNSIMLYLLILKIKLTKL